MRQGARVNLEADLLGKYVEKLVGTAALVPSRQPS
jgi:riboflavin synthase alpha subunit